MPRDVIMPALGMSQDTAQIISWLKQPGDSIRTGDALMEVETDKAVVEVEAQADGFLASVTARAGEQVPVGDVVATIVERLGKIDADGGFENSDAAGYVSDCLRTGRAGGSEASASGDSNSTGAGLPPGNEIIMPALGMVQDTGLIVRWLKGAGEPVSADDGLFEVETDKSVMEVPAGHDGYVSAILADAQQSVPVGTVIAIISADKPDTIVDGGARVFDVLASNNAAPNMRSAIPGDVANTGAPFDDVVKSRSDSGGRILASPKARRLALERGLDLARLAESGVPQPYNVADLDTLERLGQGALPDAIPAQVSAQALVAMQQITGRVPSGSSDEFLHWMLADEGLELPASSVWLRFCTAAFRRTVADEGDRLVVELQQASGMRALFVDADRSRMSQALPNHDAASANLVLRDFTDSPITSASVPVAPAAALTLGREHDDFVITFDYWADQITDDKAFRFTTDFAERLEEPLLHLF